MHTYIYVYMYTPVFPLWTAITNFSGCLCDWSGYHHELYMKSSNNLTLNSKIIEIGFTENTIPISVNFCIFKRHRKMLYNCLLWSFKIIVFDSDGNGINLNI